VLVLKMLGYPSGLNGSMQHQVELYLADSKEQNPLPGFDSQKTPSLLGLIEGDPEGPPRLKSIIGTTN
jgi:hypothetical protein